jgi:hypothetical protein
MPRAGASLIDQFIALDTTARALETNLRAAGDGELANSVKRCRRELQNMSAELNQTGRASGAVRP